MMLQELKNRKQRTHRCGKSWLLSSLSKKYHQGAKKPKNSVHVLLSNLERKAGEKGKMAILRGLMCFHVIAIF